MTLVRVSESGLRPSPPKPQIAHQKFTLRSKIDSHHKIILTLATRHQIFYSKYANDVPLSYVTKNIQRAST